MSIGDKTLHEFSANPDGQTYNGVKAIQWLFEAMTGKPMTDEEAGDLVEEAKRRAASKAK